MVVFEEELHRALSNGRLSCFPTGKESEKFHRPPSIGRLFPFDCQQRIKNLPFTLREAIQYDNLYIALIAEPTVVQGLVRNFVLQINSLVL